MMQVKKNNGISVADFFKKIKNGAAFRVAPSAITSICLLRSISCISCLNRKDKGRFFQP